MFKFIKVFAEGLAVNSKKTTNQAFAHTVAACEYDHGAVTIRQSAFVELTRQFVELAQIANVMT